MIAQALSALFSRRQPPQPAALSDEELGEALSTLATTVGRLRHIYRAGWGPITPVAGGARCTTGVLLAGRAEGLRISRQVALVEVQALGAWIETCVVVAGVPRLLLLHTAFGASVRQLDPPTGYQALNTVADLRRLAPPTQALLTDALRCVRTLHTHRLTTKAALAVL